MCPTASTLQAVPWYSETGGTGRLSTQYESNQQQKVMIQRTRQIQTDAFLGTSGNIGVNHHIIQVHIYINQPKQEIFPESYEEVDSCPVRI